MKLNAVPLPRFFELGSASPFACTGTKAQGKFFTTDSKTILSLSSAFHSTETEEISSKDSS